MLPRMLVAWSAAALILSPACGCGKKDNPPAEESASKTPAIGVKKNKTAKPTSDQPVKPPEPEMPKTAMTAEHEASCKIKVGDAMPAASLADLEGNAQELKSAYGEKLTVVLFWAEGENATTQLDDLHFDVAEKYADKGVGVAAIAETASPDDAKQAAKESKASYPILHDADGALWAQVAAAAPPRVYLLDSQGKVLWFDLEFSRASVKTLCQAIEVSLTK